MNAVLKSAPTATPAAANAPGSDYANARVLSGDKGLYPASEALRDKLCLLDTQDGDGTYVLLCLQGHRLDNDVMAYEDDLQRKRVAKPVVRFESLTTIRAIYTGVQPAAARDIDTSAMQKRALAAIADAAKVGASDVHLIIKSDIAFIRRRVNGRLEDYADLDGQLGRQLAACIYTSMCADASPTYEPAETQDGRLKPEFVAQSNLFGARIATHPTRDGQLMVIRLLHKRSKKASLLDLGYLPEQQALIERLTKKVSGINIFSGPTGSGKSTSLQVLFEELIEHFGFTLNPLTIENPCEYEIRGAIQTPLLKDGSWARSVKSMMRLDPDVLMVGEIRDEPSAAAAFDLAIAGHGIWSTTHANDAATILQRLSRLGLHPTEWSDATVLTGLINQCLVPTLCPDCKVPFDPARFTAYDADVVVRVRRFCTPNTVFIAGDGCAKCRSTGVAGRAVIAEVIAPNQEFMRLFREEGKAAAVAYWRTHLGGITKTDHLIRTINSGVVDPRHGENEVGLLDDQPVIAPRAVA